MAEIMTGSKLTAALVKAQSAMGNATLNKVNPHFKSKYADLTAVREATLSALTENGLAIMQTTEIREAGLVLKTTLRHISGEQIESEYPLPLILEKPQAMGSAITYARRYCWASMCGISADEDDDANAAQDEAKKSAPAKKAAPKSTQAKADKPEDAPADNGIDAKAEAARIKGLIDEAQTQDEVDFVMSSEKETLGQIAKASGTAHEFLLARAAAQLDKLMMSAG